MSVHDLSNCDAVVPSLSPPTTHRAIPDTREMIQAHSATEPPKDFLGKVQKSQISLQCYTSAVALMQSFVDSHDLPLSALQNAVLIFDDLLSRMKVTEKLMGIIAMACLYLSISSDNSSFGQHVDAEEFVLHTHRQFTPGDLQRMISIVSTKVSLAKVSQTFSIFTAVSMVIELIDWTTLSSTSSHGHALMNIPENEEVFFDDVEKLRVWASAHKLICRLLGSYQLKQAFDPLVLAFALLAITAESLYGNQGVHAVCRVREASRVNTMHFERAVWQCAAAWDINFPLAVL